MKQKVKRFNHNSGLANPQLELFKNPYGTFKKNYHVEGMINQNRSLSTSTIDNHTNSTFMNSSFLTNKSNRSMTPRPMTPTLTSKSSLITYKQNRPNSAMSNKSNKYSS